MVPRQVQQPEFSKLSHGFSQVLEQRLAKNGIIDLKEDSALPTGKKKFGSKENPNGKSIYASRRQQLIESMDFSDSDLSD